jgi:hypothetical protein
VHHTVTKSIDEIPVAREYSNDYETTSFMRSLASVSSG